ncbi:hypothetical protein ACXJ5A_04975 [Leuconostoc mesenteroides]|uniref:hypothetical protein n=1 Tax=Leuconostoc mesenteroides TaxID=1245 RepID=UPI0039BD7516
MEKLDFGNTWDYISSSDELAIKIEALDLSIKINSLSDLLEIYKVKTWYDSINSQFPEMQETLEKQEGKLKQLKEYIGKTLSSKSANEWTNEYLESVDNKQDKEFYEMFSEYALWTKLTEKVFKHFLWDGHGSLSVLLEQKKVVDKFSAIIKDNLINDEEMLFSNVPMITNLIEGKGKLYFPEGFENSDGFQIMVNKLLDKLNSTNFRDIVFIQPLLDFRMSELPLNEETRNRVQQYVSEFWTSQKQQGISPITSWKVSINKVQDEPIEINLNGRSTHVKISERWLDSVPEKEFLLTMIVNFVVDHSIRPLSIIRPQKSDKDETRLYEMVISNNYKGNRMYRDDLPMMMYDNQLNLTVAAVIGYLRNNNSSIEKLIANYFNQQILETHGIDGFSMIEVEPELPTNIKIKLLAIELESVLKQFKLLAEYEKINLNYLAYMDILDIDAIPSLIPNKYLQRKEGTEIKSVDFASLFVTHNYWHGYLFSSEFGSEHALTGFKEYSLLFSDEEAKFLSYCLNNKKYDNALAIRNKYLHGSTIHFTEEQHQANYIVLIKVFLIVIAKLEEEFVWNGESQNESNKG